MDNSEILVDFLEESYDLIEKVKYALSTWEATEKKDELINDVYRWVHTIKGGSAVFEFAETAAVAHALETKLGDWRKKVESVTPKDLAHIGEEILRIETLLRNGDRAPESTKAAAAQTEAPAPKSSFITLHFQEFYLDSRGIVEDMQRDGFSFLEIVVPHVIAEKLRAKLEERGLFSLQEQEIESGLALLLFVSTKEEIPMKLGGELIKKFSGQWCTREELDEPPRSQESVAAPAVKVQNTPMPQGEVLRVPLTSVNGLLEQIWELFLLHNQMSHLMKQNAHYFEENHSFLQQFDGLDTQIERTIQELESRTMSMRMSSIKKIFDRMEKVVSDYCDHTGKKIEFSTAGEGIELDKKVLDTLNEPLIHLIRNAIDHGVENREQRLAAGKTEVGKVELHAQVSGNEVHITLKDDGKGIDPQKILESARKKNLDVSQLQNEKDIINLIFAPGFSTAEQVSDVSGRGVGMDAVKKSIHELGGEVYLQTKVGEGTCFRITLPLSMSVAKSLIVKVRDLQYAFSTKSIMFVEKISVHALKKNGGDEYYNFNEELIPCFDLGAVLPDHRKHPDLPITHTHVCVISHEDRKVAFRVDDIVQTLNVVVRPMPRMVRKNPLLSGVSILPDGAPIFVLNVFEAISQIKQTSGGTHGNVA